jgi:small subunit ribosomal protein S15
MNLLVQRFQKSSKDVGSSAVQAVSLTDKITSIAEHVKRNPKDLHCRVGLMRAINLRKKMLAYLTKNDNATYLEVIKALGLRR